MRACASLVFQASAPLTARPPAERASELVGSDFRHVGRHVQRRSINSAPIAIDTQRNEKSIWPMGGITRRTRLQDRFAQLREQADARRVAARGRRMLVIQ